jgi:hypothetical protein
MLVYAIIVIEEIKHLSPLTFKLYIDLIGRRILKNIKEISVYFFQASSMRLFYNKTVEDDIEFINNNVHNLIAH